MNTRLPVTSRECNECWVRSVAESIITFLNQFNLNRGSTKTYVQSSNRRYLALRDDSSCRQTPLLQSPLAQAFPSSLTTYCLQNPDSWLSYDHHVRLNHEIFDFTVNSFCGRHSCSFYQRSGRNSDWKSWQCQAHYRCRCRHLIWDPQILASRLKATDSDEIVKHQAFGRS